MRDSDDVLFNLPLPFELRMKLLGVKWSIENFLERGVWKLLGNILVFVGLKKLAIVCYRRVYADVVATDTAMEKLFTHFSTQELEKK